jgi:Rps23 Pro-64 3,4-dihydroxylase Tpa1-like proline 4-hydroxylase
MRALESWIQSQHLSDRTLKNYHKAFTSHPSRLVVIKDFLQPRVAERLSRFLAEEAIFHTEYGVYSSDSGIAETEFLTAIESNRFFRLSKLTGVNPKFAMSPNAITYLQFRQSFQRPEFKFFFEEISGMSLGWSDDFGAHKMCDGDFLKPHSDDNRNRRLALVIYLSPDWERQFGGSLHVINQSGQDTEIVPDFNSMVAFDVLGAEQHYVKPITKGVRLSIGGWYHKSKD